MKETRHPTITVLADRYTKSKADLHNALIADNSPSSQPGSENIVKMEQVLERSFTELLASQPANIDDILIKARVFIGDVLSEAELTSYQKKSLLCVLDDICCISKLASVNSRA